MSYEYSVVPFKGFNKNELDPQTVSAHMQVLLNVGASEGWEFYQSTNVSIEVQPGCLNALFGQKSQSTKYDMLIFRRDTVTSEAPPSDKEIIDRKVLISKEKDTPKRPTNATCPASSCRSPVNMDDEKCPTCGSIFTDPQGWKPIPNFR